MPLTDKTKGAVDFAKFSSRKPFISPKTLNEKANQRDYEVDFSSFGKNPSRLACF